VPPPVGQVAASLAAGRQARWTAARIGRRNFCQVDAARDG
jgi:hypothetical protein